MDKMKQWVALTVLAALAIMAAGWMLLVAPKRGEAADLQEQVALQVSANAATETRLEILKAKAKELPKKQAELAKVAAKIPGGPALPNLIRELNRASAEAGVEFVSVTPGAPAPLVAAPPAGAAAAAPAAPAAGPAGALTAIPVNINVVGDFYDVEHFLAELEDLTRALRVTNVTMAPGQSPVAKSDAAKRAVEDGSSLNTTITGTVFMAASAPAGATVVAPAGAAPAAPGPGAPAAPAAPKK